MLPPKRFDRIKEGIRARIRHEKQKQELAEWKRETEQRDAEWEKDIAKIKELLRCHEEPQK